MVRFLINHALPKESCSPGLRGNTYRHSGHNCSQLSHLNAEPHRWTTWSSDIRCRGLDFSFWIWSIITEFTVMWLRLIGLVDDSRAAIRRTETFNILEEMLRKNEVWGVNLLIKLSQYGGHHRCVVRKQTYWYWILGDTTWAILDSLTAASVQAAVENNALTEEQRERLVALFQEFGTYHFSAFMTYPPANIS